MGLLTILKKMKQKERELRLLMLYPPGRRSGQGSGGPAGQAAPGAPYRAQGERPAGPSQLPIVRHARGDYQSLAAGAREEAVPSTRGGGNPFSRQRCEPNGAAAAPGAPV